ncbi:serine/arginine-rich splicing factor 4 isoform X2 [Lingula anatina]|uniref:Serine/arginine-rich splicing factor 4 isoform X2 n=1 Tax=Lingula anatina TaxID=7574 RepID=A0A1S3JQC5_LINAN|nr:serine/arginine-rich splicing factor 4 isoform X2 [Lingula anatina]|eukprot:XP_013412562.1 serine/arginine-rich splicing factor 4 isoform X2 [Lingula anatina]
MWRKDYKFNREKHRRSVNQRGQRSFSPSRRANFTQFPNSRVNSLRARANPWYRRGNFSMPRRGYTHRSRRTRSKSRSRSRTRSRSKSPRRKNLSSSYRHSLERSTEKNEHSSPGRQKSSERSQSRDKERRSLASPQGGATRTSPGGTTVRSSPGSHYSRHSASQERDFHSSSKSPEQQQQHRRLEDGVKYMKKSSDSRNVRTNSASSANGLDAEALTGSPLVLQTASKLSEEESSDGLASKRSQQFNMVLKPKVPLQKINILDTDAQSPQDVGKWIHDIRKTAEPCGDGSSNKNETNSEVQQSPISSLDAKLKERMGSSKFKPSFTVQSSDEMGLAGDEKTVEGHPGSEVSRSDGGSSKPAMMSGKELGRGQDVNSATKRRRDEELLSEEKRRKKLTEPFQKVDSSGEDEYNHKYTKDVDYRVVWSRRPLPHTSSSERNGTQEHLMEASMSDTDQSGGNRSKGTSKPLVNGVGNHLGLTVENMKMLMAKKKEVEKAYRQDCETFATVVKMLISKDQSLEEPIQRSLKLNLQEIGQHCIEEVQHYIEVLQSSQQQQQQSSE